VNSCAAEVTRKIAPVRMPRREEGPLLRRAKPQYVVAGRRGAARNAVTGAIRHGPGGRSHRWRSILRRTCENHVKESPRFAMRPSERP